MTSLEQAEKTAQSLQANSKELAKLTGKSSERDRTADRRSKQRASERNVEIPTLTPAQRQLRADLEADTEEWVWHMCGPDSGLREPLTYALSSQQRQMIQVFIQTLEFGGDELVLASRGEGKTTYLRAAALKVVSCGMANFIAFVGATGDDAGNSRTAIQDIVYRSKPFKQLYPEIAVPANRCLRAPQMAKAMTASGTRFDNGEPFDQAKISFTWSQDGLFMPDVPGSPSAGFMMLFRGADKAIRGLNKFGMRPKIVLMDDLDNPDTVNNIEVAKKVIDRVDLDIGGLGTQTEPLARVMLATLPKQACGVAHHYATQGHPFVIRQFRYLIEKPDRWDMWMEYVKLRQRWKNKGDKYGRKAHNFYLKNRIEMDAGAVCSNPNRFKPLKLQDGSQTQVSALQNYFDEWADKGEFYCRCELDNELIEAETQISATLEMGHVGNCEGDVPCNRVDDSVDMIVRGIDVRKIELHYATIASESVKQNRIADYNVRSHGTSETTVEQAETLILEGLNRLVDSWRTDPITDQNGHPRMTDLVLIDKGWLGNWKEDGSTKTWATQPVETFCMERGLRRFLPAKGAPRYRSPVPSDMVIVGDNWHMNRGEGQERSCTEVIWNAEHYHSLVEELFVTEDDEQRFELFADDGGVHTGHRRLAEHVCEGAEELAELKRRGSSTRKPKFRRDHWWDALAMTLVAKSIEDWFRANLKPRNRRPGRAVRSDRIESELGAR